MKVTKENIGETIYPIDNSYGKYLDNNNRAAPANMHGVVATGVVLVSEPFKVTEGKLVTDSRTKEFVLVNYNGRVCMILNIFHENEEAAKVSAERQQEDRYTFYS